MSEQLWLAEQFETHRRKLRKVAYRMLGSLSEAEDAVQDTWLKVSGTDTTAVQNLGGWLTTVLARVCLDILRARRSRREESLDAETPGRSPGDGIVDPEREVLLADSVGIALLVVLDTLDPAERLAFVLHDTFGMPFDEIAPVLGRSPDAARQLASRARRRVRGAATVRAADLDRQREVAAAFLSALRAGDFEGLLAVLDPDVVVRLDARAGGPSAPREIRGARTWAHGAGAYARGSRFLQTALLNGAVGFVFASRGRLSGAITLTFRDGKIAEADVIADPARLQQLEIAVFDASPT